MKIPNPFSNYSVVRATCKTPAGDVVCTASVRGPMEVPDDAVEVLIEPMCNGRPDSPVAAQGQIWSKEWGVQCIEEHLKKQKMVKDEKALKQRQDADTERRAREADERAKKTEKTEKIEKKVEKKVEKTEKTVKMAEKVEKNSK